MTDQPRKLGEATFEVDGKTYTLRLRHKALKEAVQILGSDPFKMLAGKPVAEVLDVMEVLVWVALKKHHPGITREEAIEVMDEAGFDTINQALAEAGGVDLARDEKKEEGAASDEGKALSTPGTGTAS